MVGSCISTVGVAISDVVMTRVGGVHRQLESSQSRDVGTSALPLRSTIIFRDRFSPSTIAAQVFDSLHIDLDGFGYDPNWIARLLRW